MIKKLMGVAVLGGVLGGAMAAMAHQPATERVDEAKVQAVIDARLHELLVKLNHR